MFFIKHDVSLMGTGVCLNGTKIYPLSTARRFAFNDVYLTFTFTFMHLADAFIQSDLQCIQVIHFVSVLCVFPGNRTHNLCAANTMLYH